MTESDAWLSALAAVEVVPSVRVLQRESFNRIVQMVIANFLRETNSVWWWTRLKVSPRIESYSGSDEFFPKLKQLVPGASRAVLLVMNDDGMPAGAIEGSFDSLVSVIEESIGFEFVIASPMAEWAIFDTHHNELLISGSPV